MKEQVYVYENQGVPILGKVAAGTPRFSEQTTLGHIPHAKYKSDSGVFALQIQGDSMIEDGIFDGNYILVRSTTEYSNGDIVIAYVNEEATVKRIYNRGSKIILQPANAELSPIEVDPAYSAFRVGGRVIEVIRN